MTEQEHGKSPKKHSEQTSEVLVDWAHEGDIDALNELFVRYYQTLVEVARRRLGSRLRSKEDPDDLAQTTFREATRDFQSYSWRGEGSLLRWLIQILQNKIRDRAEFYSATKRDFSKERRMEVVSDSNPDESTILELPSPDLTVTVQVQRVESYELLREALTELSPLHRRAITLVFFQGKSLREAGQELDGRTEDAVRMMLRRAEARLGDRLRRTLGKDLGGAKRPLLPEELEGGGESGDDPGAEADDFDDEAE